MIDQCYRNKVDCSRTLRRKYHMDKFTDKRKLKYRIVPPTTFVLRLLNFIIVRKEASVYEIQGQCIQNLTVVYLPNIVFRAID